MTAAPSDVALQRLAEDLAQRAGTLALEGRRRLGRGQAVAQDTKSSPTDPVTEFDRAAEALIVTEIRRQRPEDAIIGEEGADHAGTHLGRNVGRSNRAQHRWWR